MENKTFKKQLLKTGQKGDITAVKLDWTKHAQWTTFNPTAVEYLQAWREKDPVSTSESQLYKRKIHINRINGCLVQTHSGPQIRT